MKLHRLIFVTLCIAVAPGIACIGKQVAVTQSYYETEYRTDNFTETYTENLTPSSSLSGEYELPSYYRWTSSDITFVGFANVHYFGYDIQDASLYDDVRLKILVWKQPQYETASILVYDTSKPGQLSYPDPAGTGETVEEDTSSYKINGGNVSAGWLHTANQWIGQARLLGGRTNLWSSKDDPQVIELKAGKATKVAVIVSGPADSWNVSMALHVAWTINPGGQQLAVRERTAQKQTPYQVLRQKTVYQVKQVPFWEAILSH